MNNRQLPGRLTAEKMLPSRLGAQSISGLAVYRLLKIPHPMIERGGTHRTGVIQEFMSDSGVHG
jgi:hypothetical protein